MRSCLPLIPMSADIRSILILILFCGRHSDCFPNAKRVICVIDNSFLSNKGLRIFRRNGKSFQKDNPDYDMKIYNTQKIRQPAILFLLFAIRVIVTDVVIASQMVSFFSFVGKTSKAPCFATQNVGLTNGVFGAYDCDAYSFRQCRPHRELLPY